MLKPQPKWPLNGEPSFEGPDRDEGFVVVHLGDPAAAVCRAPVAAELKRRNPGARLVWVADLDSAELFMDHASVNEVVVYPGEYWRKKGLVAWFRGLVYAAGKLRGLRPLKGIILQGGMEAQLLLSLAGVKVVRAAPWILGMCDHPGKGRAPSLDEYGFEPSPSGSFTARRILSAVGLDASRPVALAPFGDRSGAEWPLGRYARLAGLLARRGLGPVIILGDEEDHPAANALAEAAGEGTIPLAGQGGLLVIREILRQCRAVVGSANATTFLAAALGTPTVAIASASEAHGGPAGLIYAEPGSPKNRNSRISVGSVFRWTLSAMGDHPARHRKRHGPRQAHTKIKPQG